MSGYNIHKKTRSIREGRTITVRSEYGACHIGVAATVSLLNPPMGVLKARLGDVPRLGDLRLANRHIQQDRTFPADAAYSQPQSYRWHRQ